MGNDTSEKPEAAPTEGARPTQQRPQQRLEANFSTLVLSIGSSAAMALGLAPNPTSNKTEKDRDMARFNIDLLCMLREKTKGNLLADEQKFIESIVSDLQMKFVQTFPH